MNSDKTKNLKLFKVIQLSLLILFGIMFFCYINLDPQLKNNVYSNKSLLTICVFLWAFMLYSLVCIVADFNYLEKFIIESHTLNQIAYLDSLTGLASRNSCDVIFRKYALYQDIASFGCALISIANIEKLNKESGRLYGDKCICDFSNILQALGASYGFVGRNSGNEYLLIIENCDEKLMLDFLSKLNAKISEYNNNSKNCSLEISYNYVLNNDKKINKFLDLISLLYSEKK